LDLRRTEFAHDEGTTSNNVRNFTTDFRTFMNQQHSKVLTRYIYGTVKLYQNRLALHSPQLD
jgi:hypothetical protein